MIERRRFQIDNLGCVVPFSQANRILEEAPLFEPSHLVASHRATLQTQALLGGGAELVLIVRVDGTQIALGGNVHSHRFGDSRLESLFQPRRSQGLVLVIHALIGGVFGQVVQQMPDIVQQSRHDQFGRRRGSLGERRRLQGVLQLRDGFAAVPGRAPRFKQTPHFVHRFARGGFALIVHDVGSSPNLNPPARFDEYTVFRQERDRRLKTRRFNWNLMTDKSHLTHASHRHGSLWAFWAATAAFATYFCMYGFRKPFTAATFADAAEVGGIDFKTVVVATQVLGYTLSKFIGIKVISEMPPRRRAVAILLLIAVAEVGLVIFGVLPRPWNVAGLFLNGLSLGMVFGLVLGFLEGRRLTEALAAGLCASFILADGVTKSVGTWLLDKGITEYWMPSVAGLIFLVPLCIGVWMLARIPSPTQHDIEARTARPTLTRTERWSLFGRYAGGLSLLVAMYLLVTVIRSIRADFAPELWKELGEDGKPAIFTRSEMYVALGVLLVNGLAACIRNNRLAFFVSLGTCCFGFLLITAALVSHQQSVIRPFPFMVLVGLGLYLPYVAMHTTVFERLLAMTRERGNLGFLMYVADAFGYLGYVAVMIARNLWNQRQAGQAGLTSEGFLQFFVWSCWVAAGLSLFCLVLSWRYFAVRGGQAVAAASPEAAV